ncbi:MAG: isoprenylcysteine carboxylmethyltransferase family protein [Myxococcaceae bacterium]
MRRALSFIVPIAFVLVVVFVPGGRLDFPRAWALLAFLALCGLAQRLYVAARNPTLFAARATIGEGTPRFEYAWSPLWWLFLFSEGGVAGVQLLRFDVEPWPWWTAIPGATLIALGFALSARSMAENPHFEGTVRIQRDRGHRVIDTGPYRVVRHPGYVGLILWALGQPLVLGSSWALVPAVIATSWVIVRTRFEDDFLRRGLDGYEAFTQRTRYRLLPGVW